MANQLSLSLYDELINSFDEVANTTKSETIQNARKQALQSFKQQGFPTRRNEEWKYTNITPYLQEKYVIDGVSVANIKKDLVETAQIPHLDCYQLILVNGQLQSKENLS